MVKFMSKRGFCQLKTDTCYLHLQRLNHGHCNCWLSTPLKGVQGENQEWDTVLWEKLAEQAFWQLNLFRRRFYEFQFLHLLIPRKTLTSLMVTSALAIKKNFTVKSQNRVTMVQTSREIIRWYYGYNFRLDVVLLNTWVFSVVSGLKVKVKSLSRVQLLGTPWTVAHQAPPSMGFSRQEYWNELPFPSPGDLSDPGIKPRSPALQADAGRRFNLWATREI